MNVFVDTSGFLSVLDADDKHHEKSRKAWCELVSSDTALISNNYVLLETFALVQNRLGIKAVAALTEDILPIVHIEWVDENVHKAGVAALMTAARRNLSLVDCVSFETMRQQGLKTAFTLDSHFREQGFKCVP